MKDVLVRVEHLSKLGYVFYKPLILALFGASENFTDCLKITF